MSLPPEIIDGYINNLPPKLVQINELVKNSDFKSIIEFGHKLAGSGASYGFQILSVIGRSFEKFGEEENISEIESTRNHFAKAIEEITAN